MSFDTSVGSEARSVMASTNAFGPAALTCFAYASASRSRALASARADDSQCAPVVRVLSTPITCTARSWTIAFPSPSTIFARCGRTRENVTCWLSARSGSRTVGSHRTDQASLLPADDVGAGLPVDVAVASFAPWARWTVVVYDQG
ncbi:hypothetical protein GCM10025864_40980 [Luteimicrobium album]|uniref:Uncharacterized protein n=1 Tax=Luteimicrobium album TaxID=1054550 RepID=A0ABQ6I8K4_9MICO|nr:hypothetical protein GCM10025864_40980 [Luteimicrobium album]